MMRPLFIFILMACAAPVQANEFWTNLWHNADQRGDALMRQGDASLAAKEYADPRRKAYAKLQAGDYQGAAQDLGKLHDSDSDYNRGNALAHAGDLQGALQAYDAALKSNPENHDAKHNRDLLASAMKPPKPGNQNGQPGKPDDKGQQGQNPSAANKQDENGKQNKTSPKPGQADHQSGKEQISSGNAGKPQDSRDIAGKNQGEKGNADQGAAASAALSDEARAKQAQALPARAGQGAAGKTEADEGSKAAPKSEQQMAEEQWLRSIPDDPGGLLRRKFLIEHMLRQQREQP